MPEHIKQGFQVLQGNHDELGKRQKKSDERFDTLIRHLSKFEHRDSPKSMIDPTETVSLLDPDDDSSPPRPVKPDFRFLNYERFKNNYGDEDHQCCIEGLIGGPQLRKEIEDEATRRGEPAADHIDSPQVTYDEDLICSVRIRSPMLLRLLAVASGVSWNGRTNCIFVRPFAQFIHTFDHMKMELQNLETQLTLASPSTIDPGNPYTDFSEAHATRMELLVYIEFVANRILPQMQRYDDLSTPEAKSVQFADLWYLFRVGQLVCVPKFASNDSITKSTTQCVFRICGIWRPDTASYWPTKRDKKEEGSKYRRAFKLKLYSIDYDGETYGPFFHSIDIPVFDRPREVTSLPAYPLCCHPQSTATSHALQQQGRDFIARIDEKHITYRGWTIITDLAGKSLKDANRQPLKHPDYVESDMIVDFKETFQNMPLWRPTLPHKKPRLGRWLLGEEKVSFIHWAQSGRLEKVSDVPELVQESDGIDQNIYNKELSSNPFLGRQRAPSFKDEDFMLLPRRLFAYALRDRKFHQVEVRHTRPANVAEDSPFDSLVINQDHLKIIQSVVISHFQKKTIDELSENTPLIEQDFIHGKGQGLIILLHGAPGVGKTTTAEAIALEYRKPLFAISSGDIGWQPDRVETSLREIFRLAHLWDCILLTAIVSVFLRVLEYYNGILFLTTNRVGTIDEAVKSRVHVSLHYPSLDDNQITKIVEMNLKRLKEIDKQRSRTIGQQQLIFTEEDICDEILSYGKHEHDRPWNGRQIRNAVQTAACLAWYDRKMSEEPEKRPVLRVSHFRKVKETISLFDEYMTRTTGLNDTLNAAQRGERYDNFKSTQEPNIPPRGSIPRSDSGASGQQTTPFTSHSSWGQGQPYQNPGSGLRQDSHSLNFRGDNFFGQ